MEKLTLIQNGVSACTIVHGGDAAEVFAAEELAAYLYRITGVTLPVQPYTTAEGSCEIVVGRTDRRDAPDTAGLGEDGFVIRTVGEKLFLTGGSPRGSLYAVYELLEKYLGCRFYSSDFEKIPECPAVVLDTIDDRQVPVFIVRNDFWADYIQNPHFAAKRKMNGKKDTPIPEKFGGSMKWAGGSCHTIGTLAEMEGDHTDRQPCLSDEAVYETVRKNVRRLLADHPDAKFISVSQNDSHDWGVGCQCEACMKIYRETGSYAGSFIQFVNRIADDIREDYPDVMIHTFAYRYTRQAPKGVVPRPNVMVELCSIEACFRHSLAECTTVGNAHEAADDFAELIRDWSAISENLSVWDYTTNFANYNLTFPNLAVLRDNMRLFADRNVKYVFEQGAYQSRNGEFCELRGYLLARLLWDPYMTEEEYNRIIDEFYTDFYGEGGTYIRQYADLALAETADRHVSIYISLEDLYPNRTVENHGTEELPENLIADDIRNGNTDWIDYTGWYSTILPHPLLEKGIVWFAEALDAVTDPAVRANVERSMIQMEVLRSFFRYRLLQSHKENLNRVLRGVLARDGIAAEEAETLAASIADTQYGREEQAYIAENRALKDKMDRLGVFYLTEGFDTRTRDTFRFHLPVTHW